MSKSSDLDDLNLFPAGSSMVQSHIGIGMGEDCLVPHTWEGCDASTFQMRIGPNYNWNKQKAPSAKALYELVGVDFVKCPKKVVNIASYVTIPEEWSGINTGVKGVPPVFVVNAQLPSDFSTSFFYEITDGDGWSLVFYFKITEETLEALQNLETASPAVKLFVNYCQNAPEAYKTQPNNANNLWIGRFKVTIRCENLEKFGLPSFITSYNAKPVLIRHTGTLLRGEDETYIEMDINIHRFSSVPKKALELCFNRFDQMILSMGFCIESREDCELPETLFGCGTLVMPTHAMSAPWVHPVTVPPSTAGKGKGRVSAASSTHNSATNSKSGTPTKQLK